MHTVLITGGAGFIGSNFIPYFLENNKGSHIVNLDLLTYAGDLSNLLEIESHPNYTFIKGDVCDRKFIESLFNKYKFTGVIHFAAESHVDNSIKYPDAFVRTNVFGTFNLLDVAKNHWMKSPNVFKEGYENCRFHHISTDEVYGTLDETGLFTEDTPYAPNSPYSASKAGVVNLTRAGVAAHAAEGIRVNAIAPSVVDTPLVQHFIESSEDPEATREQFANLNPYPGMVSMECVTSTALFLVSDDSEFINGITIPIDGGYTAL